MKLGKAALEALQAEITGRLIPGDELVAAGAIALLGTSVIARRERNTLKNFFSTRFLEEAVSLPSHYGISGMGTNGEAWKLAAEYGATAFYEIRQNGILSALWKMAEASGVGLQVDLRKIPVRQETIEICERYDINPYKLISGDALLLGIRGGEALVQAYEKKGIMAAVIGQANSGNSRLLYSGENARYLERPGQDEIRKICPDII